MAEMLFVPTAEKIDLTSWEFFPHSDLAVTEMLRGLVAIVSEVVCSQFAADPPDIYFPGMWKDSDGNFGPCPTDPAVVYVGLPLSQNDNNCCWKISLEAVVDELIEDTAGDEFCHKLAMRLRELADKLDAATTAVE